MTSVYDILDELGATAGTVERGTRFERLIRAFLMTDPVYAEQFSDVWLWKDWPGRDGKPDTGIDLVAQDRLSGGFVAVQCKFYAASSVISKKDIDTFMSESGKYGFVQRIVVSTTDKWNVHAENAIKNQQIPVRRIGLADLESSPIDWGQFSLDTPDVMVTTGKNTPRPHQQRAIEAAVEGFETGDRGRVIMACGTGKTFMSLRLAERAVGAGGSVLFLVPSISLLSQTLREWLVHAEVPLTPIAVCSDRKSTAQSAGAEDIATVDLALPATTSVEVLGQRLQSATSRPEAMTVVFSTYQSIDVVARAQAEAGVAGFDLIVCDEAHRTTGVTLAGQGDESPFVRVHDNSYVQGAKRLYMTATPRIYDEATRTKAGEADAVLASMDDETLFGPELFRLGFGEAVAQGLLTDYKVLVLAVDNAMVATSFQHQLADSSGELQLDDVAKIVGCWNGLAKRGQAEHDFATDPAPMKRAVAFAGTIKTSKRVEATFSNVVNEYDASAGFADERTASDVLDCEVRHVDGTFNALERNSRLDWLRGDVPDGRCRILTNARCLSEGVDVPALDAVMFLSARRSVVDVVQSVGRVMRKAPGKQYGYIILPVAIPDGVAPEVALRDNARYQVVWEVLQALRAHDDRLNSEINKIDLTSNRSDRINVIGVGAGDDGSDSTQGVQGALALSFSQLEEWRDAVYARIVAKVGSRRYWEEWASSVAQIAESHITRITALLDADTGGVLEAFDGFLEGLRANLNSGIGRSDAVEMLAQHLITRPVFDALFAGYDFAAHNPVAAAMEHMLAVLDEHNLHSENADLEGFYDSVRSRVDGIDTAEGRQRIIVDLYDKFFSTAFKRTVDKLGIVYTPVEIVDFIVQSAEDLLRAEFGQGLTDENVHILDGFVGTGTFITRLIQSGLLTAADLPRKYASELHANEILLLAYYIAAVNIESSYLDVMAGHLEDQAYTPFPGLILTDTFQSWEVDEHLEYEAFRENNKRLERLRSLPITVIIGNPPYSIGQGSANDNNANESYPSLDQAIRETYAAEASRDSFRGLYDSYIRAIKWASLQIHDRGVIVFVINSGLLDSSSFDGMRKTLVKEFSSIHIYNLRGNRRNAGAEGRPIFEAYAKSTGGSIAGIAVVALVKNPEADGDCTIRYAQVSDYTTARQKLDEVVAARSLLNTEARVIVPNDKGDWLRQRTEAFEGLIPLRDHDPDIVGEVAGLFSLSSKGLTTNRDPWVYNSSADALEANVKRLVATYAASLESAGPRVADETQIKWSRRLDQRFARGKDLPHDSNAYRIASYRPFDHQHVYFSELLNEDRRRLPDMFPTVNTTNVGFLLTGVGSHYEFAVTAADAIPDLHLLDTGQFFPRWRWEPVADTDGDDGTLEYTYESTGSDDAGDVDEVIVDGYRRVDNITDWAVGAFREAYGPQVTKDDVFFYAYGLLHSPDYRSRFADDLRKLLPRVPLVEDGQTFIDAGRELFQLHLGYAEADRYPLGGLDVAPVGDPWTFFRVEKMGYGKQRVGGKSVPDRTVVQVNSRIALSEVPEPAQQYRLGPRSALDWVIERYRVKRDKKSHIVNDPNDWAKELDDPRFIVDLVARVVTVSLETVRIVETLPDLSFRPS